MRKLLFAIVSLHLALFASAREPAPSPPSQLFGELFTRVQNERLFPDSKTFADAAAKAAPEEILRRYAVAKGQAGFSLAKFVDENFDIPGAVGGDFKTAPREEVRDHIDRLWAALSREPRDVPGVDSLLPLTTRYVVPGGRFRELYYWDSYFTMVGLQRSGHDDLVADMIENFAGLVDRYGHIPNGARTYQLSRSQPPFFSAMVELQAQRAGVQALVKRLPQLEREHDFWMSGAARLAPGNAYRRVVRLADGTLLNRYWDDLAIPRDEAFFEDSETARGGSRPPTEVYRDLRAAAESGWDFSSRWLVGGDHLSATRTTDFLAVDLNSLLYLLERAIARGCQAARRPDCDADMSARAGTRRNAMFRLMWDEKAGAFVDYNWRSREKSKRITAATAYPLFAGLATRDQARRVARTLETSLVNAHGLATTAEDTGQQWDAPNGWAPLNWIAIAGLRKHGENTLAAKIAAGWVAENARVYCKTGKLVEKYNVRDAGAGAGGEYPVQDGFGWTNAVLVELLAIYPDLSRPRYEFTGGECASR
jgi:alpha,alpha-trehalase